MTVDCSVTIDPRYPDVRKSLAVQEPYASLIIDGVKQWEIRKTPLYQRGTVWIYTSKRPVPLHEHLQIIKKYSTVKENHDNFIQSINMVWKATLGYLIGTVEIVDCYPITREQFENSYLHYSGRGFPSGVDVAYVWVLANPKKIEPIKYERPQGAIIFSTKGRIIQPRVIL